LTGVYKKESVDVVSVSLYLQGLQKDELAPEFTELDPDENLSDSDYKLDNKGSIYLSYRNILSL